MKIPKIKKQTEIYIHKCKKCGYKLTSGEANYCGNCFTDNPEIKSYLVRYPTGEQCTSSFWNCNCKGDEKVHFISSFKCSLCGAKKSDCEKSTKKEVIAFFELEEK